MKNNNLITVFRTRIDGTKTFRRITMDEFIEEVRSTRYERVINTYCQSIPMLRCEPLIVREALIAKALDNVPEVCFAAELSWKAGEINVSPNPYLLLSISNLRNSDRVEELKAKCSLLPYTRMAFRGVDKLSLHIVCELRGIGMPDTGSEAYATLHKKAYTSLRKIYSDHLHAVVDVKEPSLFSSCRMSYDTDVYYNPLSHPFHVDMQSQTLNPLSADTNHQPEKVDDREEMYEWRRIYVDCARKAQENTVGEESDFDTVLLLARYCCETGMPQALAERWTILSYGGTCDETLIRDTFTEEYSKELKNCDKYRHSSASARMIMRTTDFLNTHFRFRRNVLNGIVEYRMNDGSDFDYHLLTPEVQNTMTIMALESGLNSWDKDLNRYIHSKRIPEYDPVNTYLDNLPKWDGKDRIADIARRVPTDTPDWTKNFHVWMLSMVAQWMGRDDQHGNAIAPILIGAQATGKSSFCRILLPESLSAYYNDSINFKDDKSVFLALSSFALINIDEFDSLSRSQQPLLKYLISKTDVKYRAAYRSYIEQHKRYASFIGTTNKPRPLTDPTGSRRFICVHVTGAIDFTTPIDHAQVYAQLREEVLNGERYWFTKEEADRITQQNNSFQRADDLRSIILSMFRMPQPDEEAQFLTIEEIIKMITNAHPEVGNLMDMKVGRLLSQIGFEKVRGHRNNKYKVLLKL